MPVLTIKHADVSGTADVTDPDKVNENLYEPDATTPDTCEIVNGWLDANNHDEATDLFDADAFQPGAFIRTGQVGSNVAFDVFDDLFPRVLFDPDDTTDETKDLIPVPGANIRFYLPFAPTRVLFMWSLCWTTDLLFYAASIDRDHCAPAHFAVNGKSTLTQPHANRRVCPATVQKSGLEGVGAPDHVGFTRYSQVDQKWSGHKLVSGLSAGWNTAGLYLGISDAYANGPDGANSGVRAGDISQQARVRSRSIRYIAFK